MNSKKQIIIIQAILPNKTQTYEIDKSEFTFGRGGKSDVVVRDAGISREHMKIKLVNGIPHVRDLGSLNGVYIDGYKINPENFIAVQNNCILSFGKCAVTLKISVVGTAGDNTTAINEKAIIAEVKIPEATEQYIENASEQKTDLPLRQSGGIKPQVPAEPKQHAETEIIEIPQPKPEPKAEAKSEPQPEPKAEAKPKAEPESDSDNNPIFNKLMDLSAFPKSEEDYRINFKNIGLDLPKYKNPSEHAKEIIQEAEYQKYAIIKNAEVVNYFKQVKRLIGYVLIVILINLILLKNVKLNSNYI